MRKDDHGFTLVEVVVITVILVILATISIPALTSYLAKSNDEKNQQDAKDIFNSVQISFYNLYAENAHDDNEKSIIKGVGNSDNPNVVIESTDYENKKLEVSIADIHDKNKFPICADIFKNIGIKMTINNKGQWESDMPCCVMAITGDYATYCDPTKKTYNPRKAYTVYALVFNQNLRGDFFILLSDGRIKYPNSKIEFDKIIASIVDDEDPNSELKKQVYMLKNGAGDGKGGENDAFMWKYFHLKAGNTGYCKESYKANGKKQDVE